MSQNNGEQYMYMPLFLPQLPVDKFQLEGFKLKQGSEGYRDTRSLEGDTQYKDHKVRGEVGVTIPSNVCGNMPKGELQVLLLRQFAVEHGRSKGD